jgi:hypothetical protein
MQERFGRTWRHLTSQDTARTNAAQASATLRQRRLDHEEVDAFLTGSGPTQPEAPPTSVSSWCGPVPRLPS